MGDIHFFVGWLRNLPLFSSKAAAIKYLREGVGMAMLRCNAVGMLSTVLAFLLTGCAYTDHFDDRSGTYGTVAAQSRDRMILTNVLRASHGEPLSFVSVGAINGTSSAQSTFGLPPLVFGPHVAAATSGLTHALQGQTIFGGSAGGGNGFVGNSMNALASTNFQVTPVETKEFYEGLLRNVDPRILQLFVEQGVARELLFYLFTDRIVVEKGGQKLELRNDPLDPGFGVFKHYVKLAMEYGLASEPQPQRGKAKAADSSAKTAVEGPEIWQLCFDDVHRVRGVPDAGNGPKCGAKVNSAEERTVSFKSASGEPEKLTVLPRSPFGIFQYLGRIAASGERGRVLLQSSEAIDAPPFRDEVLFEVVSGGEEADCYLTVAFKTQTYCIPEHAINSKRIMGLLTQLIALNTAIADVPVTPSVRVIQ
jgi:hypothetical protein